MNNPIVSFIIPVFNGAATIGMCVKSIVESGIEPSEYEIICVDDASIDGITGETLQEIAAAYPSVNIQIVTHETNKRQGGARNTGVRAAKGKYIMFIDCDDTYYPDVLNHLVKDELEEGKYDLFFFSYTKNGRLESDFPALYNTVMTGEQLFQKGIAPWGPVLYAYRRELLLRNKCFFVENHFFEDVDYTLKVTLLAKSIKILPLCVYNYYVNENSTSNIGFDQKKLEDSFLSYKRVFDLAAELTIDKKTVEMMEELLAFMYKRQLLSLSWRLDFHKRIEYYRVLPPQSVIHSFWSCFYRFPVLMGLAIGCCRPFLKLLSRCKMRK